MLLRFPDGTTVNSEMVYDIQLNMFGDDGVVTRQNADGTFSTKNDDRPTIVVLYKGYGGDRTLLIRCKTVHEMNKLKQKLRDQIGFKDIEF